MIKRIKTSITELVKLSCASGDLVNTGPAGPTALQGQYAHKKLQQQRDEHQQAEVKISAVIDVGSWQLTLGGRADLMNLNCNPPHIIEIKSCLSDPKNLPQSQREQHWAQLKFYGFCELHNKPELAAIKLSLQWINVSDNSLKTEDKILSRAEINTFCESAILRFLAFHQLINDHRESAIASAQALEFPFSQYRDGQRSLATAVFRCIRDNGRLLSEAPTGIGKTISTLFPAVKAFGHGHTQSIFYLTAKNSGRQSANQSIQFLRQQGLAVSSVQLSAKRSLCHCSNGSCERTDEGHCPLTLGFFDRLPAAREELIKLKHIDVDTLDKAAYAHKICPFELSLQLIPWVDVVICDYNYVFDPLVRLTHIVENAKHITLLVDEAHNLVDRARNMYSADLSHNDLVAAKNNCTRFPELAKRFSSVARSLKKESDSHPQTQAEAYPPARISKAVAKCIQEFSISLSGKAFPAELIEPFKDLYRYNVIEELYGSHHRTLISRHNSDRQTRLACLNATDKLQASFASFKSVICFSATLSPLGVYQHNLGMPLETLQQQLPSPFQPEQLSCHICTGIDTRFAARESSADDLIQLIEQVYYSKPGNYLVFFPSYQYLESIKTRFEEKHPDIPVVAQPRTSDPDLRNKFRQVFAQPGYNLGFAILGGVFSEGVDFLGDSLLGAIVVGTGLSAVNTEQKLIQADFDQNGLDGFEYAFKYPGMTRVLQAAGRVIRSESDKGVLLLADRRFGQSFYRKLMPLLWQPQLLRNHLDISQRLQQFWETVPRQQETSI